MANDKHESASGGGRNINTGGGDYLEGTARKIGSVGGDYIEGSPGAKATETKTSEPPQKSWWERYRMAAIIIAFVTAVGTIMAAYYQGTGNEKKEEPSAQPSK